MNFQGHIRSFEYLDKMIKEGYLFTEVKDGEFFVKKPDGTIYNVSVTGVTFPLGCTCPGGEYEAERQSNKPERGEWQNACKHRKIAMDSHKCIRCGNLQMLHIYKTPNGEEKNFFACLKCNLVTDAPEILKARQVIAMHNLAQEMGVLDE